MNKNLQDPRFLGEFLQLPKAVAERLGIVTIMPCDLTEHERKEWESAWNKGKQSIGQSDNEAA